MGNAKKIFAIGSYYNSTIAEVDNNEDADILYTDGDDGGRFNVDTHADFCCKYFEK